MNTVHAPVAVTGMAGDLGIFLPPFAHWRLAAASAPQTEASADDVHGIVLMIDLTGFTTMTERLDRSGPHGAEILARELDLYFEHAVGLIEQRGGLVAKLFGDSIMAVWPVEPAHTATLAHAVVDCAFTLQASLGAQVVGTLGLSAKAAIAAGRIVHGFFGGIGQHWATMLGGPAMEDARKAMRQCASGDVVACRVPGFTGETDDPVTLGPHVHDTEAASAALLAHAAGAPRVAEPAVLEAYVSTVIRDTWRAGVSQWLPEFRQVSLVFVHVPQLRLQEARDGARIQRVCALVQQLAQHFGGMLEELGEDHDGLVIKAAFGVPGASHEDDAARAVRTAQAIHRAIAARGFRDAIGVTTGRLFCGSTGSQSVRGYSLVGDTINRCARLMQLGLADIVCDENTQSAAERLAFEAIGTVSLRGKVEPTPMFRPRPGGALRSHNDQPLLGRATECAHLEARVAAFTTTRAPTNTLIVGEPGIGKSAMLRYLRHVCGEHGAEYLEGAGDAIEVRSAYHAWRPVLRTLLGATAETPTDALRAIATERALEAGIDTQLLGLLNPLLGLAIPDNALLRAMNARSRLEQTVTLVIALLRHAAAGRALVVALEDSHWLDSASLELTQGVLRSAVPLMLVLACRPRERDDQAWQQLREAMQGGVIELQALARDAVLALVRQQLGGRNVAAEVEHLIWEKGDGNPFFSEELCRALQDGAALISVGDAWRLKEPGTSAGFGMEGTVQGVVAARIDQLPPWVRVVMRVASVYGRRFPLEVLEYACRADAQAASVPADLEALIARDFVQATAQPGIYEFRHAIVQDVAYQQLAFAQRRLIHASMAEWLERAQSQEHALLAHHWTQADNGPRAVLYLDLAGTAAFARFANREAEALLDRALALVGEQAIAVDAQTRGRWLRQRAESRFHLGRVDDSRSDFVQAMGVLGWPVPARARMLALALPAGVLRQLVGLWWPRRAAPDQAGMLEEALAAVHMLGEVAYFDADILMSAWCVFQGANLADELGDSPAGIAPYCGVMLIAGLMSRALGEAYFRRSSAIAARHELPLQHAYVLHIDAILQTGFCRWPRVENSLREATVLFRRYGNGRRLEEALLMQVYAFLYQGRYAECAPCLAELETSAQRRGDTQTQGWGHLLRAQLALAQDGPAVALSALGDDLESGLDHMTRTAMLATAAVAHARHGDWTAAMAAGRQALLRNERNPASAHTMLLYLGYVAEVFVGRLADRADAPAEERRAALAEARRAIRCLKRFARAFPLARPRTRIWQGALACLRGRTRAARTYWQDAARQAESVALAPDQRRAYALQNAATLPTVSSLAEAESPAVAEFDNVAHWVRVLASGKEETRWRRRSG